MKCIRRWLAGGAGAGNEGAGREGASLDGRRFPAEPLLTEGTVLLGPAEMGFNIN